MQIAILIEPVLKNGFRVRTGEPLPLQAEGATRDEAIRNLRKLVEQRLADGSELTSMELAASSCENPWMKFAGMFDRNDPLVKEWKEQMAENRRNADMNPDVL